MSFMNIPGFSAAASLYNRNTKYNSNISAIGNLDSVGKIVPQIPKIVAIGLSADGCITVDYEDPEERVSWSRNLNC
jgi:hypothetical protein